MANLLPFLQNVLQKNKTSWQEKKTPFENGVCYVSRLMSRRVPLGAYADAKQHIVSVLKVY